MSKKIGYFKPFKRIINFEIAICEKIHEKNCEEYIRLAGICLLKKIIKKFKN